jgi:hypothetical protein
MHSWKNMVNLLETVDMPKVVGFQADMSHTLLYTLGENAGRPAGLGERRPFWAVYPLR